MRAADLLIGTVRIYQKAIAPFLGACCRFHPSCSDYMIGSISKNGCVLGVLSGLWRIVRCNPFHPGGVDEPRQVRLFRTRAQWKNG